MWGSEGLRVFSLTSILEVRGLLGIGAALCGVCAVRDEVLSFA